MIMLTRNFNKISNLHKMAFYATNGKMIKHFENDLRMSMAKLNKIYHLKAFTPIFNLKLMFFFSIFSRVKERYAF